MNIDERLEFLLQSTESLHSTVMEQSRQMVEQSKRVDQLMTLSERNERRWNRFLEALRDALDAGLDENGSEP